MLPRSNAKGQVNVLAPCGYSTDSYSNQFQIEARNGFVPGFAFTTSRLEDNDIWNEKKKTVESCSGRRKKNNNKQPLN